MPDETITIRRDLRRSQPLQAAVVPRATPKTFYVIPGCYAGDTRPRADQLPARCKLAGLRIIPPVVAPPGRAQ
jgi:hypothetical protein